MIEKMLSEDSDDEDESDDENSDDESDDDKDADDKGSDASSDDDSDSDDDDVIWKKRLKNSEMIIESPAIRKFALMYGMICLKASDKISRKAAKLMFESVAKASKDIDVVDDKRDLSNALTRRVHAYVRNEPSSI